MKGSVSLPVFAYLRKSTNKKEQELSLVQQEEGVNIIAEHLGVKLQDVKSYTETKSGFENKKRTMWNEMITEIDKLKTPCILLARDTSRLSRNQKDNLAITDRLYGDNGHKIKIQSIYFLGKNLEVLEWSNRTGKKALTDKLKQNYDESLETKEKSITGILLKLSNREFPYPAPKGLESYIREGRRILKQNEKMPIIIRAFEMKTGGNSHKEISDYLLKYGNIKIGEKDLTDRLFKNTVYIGKYTEKTSGTLFSNLEFYDGKPSVPLSLWDNVQKCLGRKISQYGERQKGDVIAEKLRTENRKRMSKYLAKNKYPQYKNTIERIHISEHLILSGFINFIKDILKQEFENSANYLTQIINDLCEIKEISERQAGTYIESEEPPYKRLGIDPMSAYYMVKKDSITSVANMVSESPYFKGVIGDKKTRDAQIDVLKKQKNEIEQSKINLTRKFAKDLIGEDLYRDTLKDIENDISNISKAIEESSDDTDIEKYLVRLPEILLKTFELARKTIDKAKTEGMKDDLLMLMQLTTVELTVNNKKELKVKLFDVLDRLISSDESALEAPPGVEPGYGALQAPT